MAEEKHGEHGGGEGHEKGGHGGGHGGGGHGGGHGGAHEEHEGVPEWMISFADNTALMMGLFVILLAMNMGPKAKAVMGGEPSDIDAFEKAKSNDMLDFVIGIREAFNNPVDINSSNPRDAKLRKRLQERMHAESTNEVQEAQNNREGGAVRPSEYDDVAARIDFEDGSSLLSSSSRQVIVDTARKLGDTRYIIEVRGHAGAFETFRNVEKGLELSLDRARSVARELAAQGVRWGQIRVAGSGDNERLVQRTFDRNSDATNQRVEIIVTRELVAGEPASGDRPASND